ncbi:hypothetical protein ABIE32_001180 [Comamonas sp. 4034]
MPVLPLLLLPSNNSSNLTNSAYKPSTLAGNAGAL